MSSSKTYLVGDYNRFSSKEDDSKESNSIQSQRDINIAFIEELNKKFPDDTFIHVDSYSDDDYTGTNFNRPDFKRLVKDCRSGKINCVIVKDSSRFGRNASKMQIILEEDLEDVRYISKLDGFDSRFDDYDSMFQIRNVFNQMYAEDISRKVHSSIDSKQKQGKFLGSFTCYGYKKSAEDKHVLEVDENVKYVIEMIFELRLKGMNLQTIARHLNSLNLPSPTTYKQQQGMKYRNHYVDKFNDADTQLWTYSTLHRLLTNQTYKGNLTQGRVRQKMRKKAKVQAKEDWVIVEGACPAIIEPPVFDEVQRLLRESNHIKANPEVSPFAGIIKCGECSHSMTKAQKNKEALYFVCRTRKAQGKQYCDNDYIRADVLEKIILADLNSIIAEIKDLNGLMEDNDSDTDSYMVNLEKQLKQVQTDIERSTRSRRKSYSDYQEGILSKADYLYTKEDTEKKETVLLAQIEKLKVLIQNYSPESTQNTFIEKLLSTKQIDVLDRAIMQEMIETIYIFKNKKIKIVYKFADEVEALRQIAVEHVAP